MSARLANANKADLPGIYAQEGIWYDALEAVSDLVDTQPDNVSWRTERADLLQQAGVTNARRRRPPGSPQLIRSKRFKCHFEGETQILGAIVRIGHVLESISPVELRVQVSVRTDK